MRFPTVNDSGRRKIYLRNVGKSKWVIFKKLHRECEASGFSENPDAFPACVNIRNRPIYYPFSFPEGKSEASFFSSASAVAISTGVVILMLE